MATWLPWGSRRREHLRHTPLPAGWRALVAVHVPLAGRLTDEQRSILDGLVQVFLADKVFEGCGGLALTDEIRVTIATLACLLLVGLEVDDPYPGLDVIRVYPASVRVPREEHDGWVVTSGPVAHLGLSSRRGYVVLAWDAVRRGSADPTDGQNVVLHEFAHQLDGESGATNGAPVLPANLYRPWAKALGDAYAQLLRDVDEAGAARPEVIDRYGATSPAEFFAVVTEVFFERPERLQAEHPELYDVLVRYYRQDPRPPGRSRPDARR